MHLLSISASALFLTTLAIPVVGHTPQAAAPAVSVPAKSNLVNPFYVAGYSVRTNNIKEAGGDGEIAKLWMRFYQEGLQAQIPHQTGGGIIVAYSDYSSHEPDTEYTYLLGTQVDSIEGLPKDLAYRKIPAGTYAVVPSEQGMFQEVIPAVWKKIWTTTPAQLGGNRTFLTDYETYTQDDSNPGSGKIEVHLGIQP
jgi:predicted transcriptional regulator YdeE